ncbi:general odorant-binding protein 2-like [Cydia fagiglandana]|uniref:general odorant-binding protein 2-like n=1 Tax=Cydia fagiglandana TaxID=1458189 RepID=UPI002FEE3830
MALCWIVVAVILAAAEIMEATSDKSITMSRVAGKFGKTLEGGRDEVRTVFQAWNQDFDVDRREIGCAIICMSNKFSLLQDDNHVQHDSLADYLKSFDNGDALAATAADLYKNCEEENGHIDDDCSRIAKLFACFKTEAKRAGIAPYVDLIKDVLNESYDPTAKLEIGHHTGRIDVLDVSDLFI